MTLKNEIKVGRMGNLTINHGACGAISTLICIPWEQWEESVEVIVNRGHYKCAGVCVDVNNLLVMMPFSNNDESYLRVYFEFCACGLDAWQLCFQFRVRSVSRRDHKHHNAKANLYQGYV